MYKLRHSILATLFVAFGFDLVIYRLRNDSTRPIGDLWRRAVDRGHDAATTRRPSLATRTVEPDDDDDDSQAPFNEFKKSLHCSLVCPNTHRHRDTQTTKRAKFSNVRIYVIYAIA